MSLDLYFKLTDKVTFSVSGKNTVHLTGYWDLTPDFQDEGMGLDGMEMDMNEEEESEEEDDEFKKNRIIAKQNAMKNAKHIPVAEEEDEFEEEEDESEEEDIQAALQKKIEEKKKQLAN